VGDALGKIEENTPVALEGCDQVVTISPHTIPGSILRTTPLETGFIMRDKLEEAVLGMLGVATAAPHTITRTPTAPGEPKVRTEQSLQTLLQPTTGLAVALPGPEVLVTA
jgi:hypothetical protein